MPAGRPKKSSDKVEIKIRCQYKEMVPLDELKPHPKNRNVHTNDQINRLAQIIKYQGFRNPIVVSELSGCIVTGHGRLDAAKKLGMETVPVDYQEFESEESEYAHLIADNSISEWSSLDLSAINSDITDLGPDFDLDFLGVKEFSLDPDFEPATQEEQGQLDQIKLVIMECPHCGDKFEKQQAKIID